MNEKERIKSDLGFRIFSISANYKRALNQWSTVVNISAPWLRSCFQRSLIPEASVHLIPAIWSLLFAEWKSTQIQQWRGIDNLMMLSSEVAKQKDSSAKLRLESIEIFFSILRYNSGWPDGYGLSWRGFHHYESRDIIVYRSLPSRYLPPKSPFVSRKSRIASAHRCSRHDGLDCSDQLRLQLLQSKALFMFQ